MDKVYCWIGYFFVWFWIILSPVVIIGFLYKTYRVFKQLSSFRKEFLRWKKEKQNESNLS